MKMTHVTKDGFGGIYPSGIKCRIVSVHQDTVYIESENRIHFWGNMADLDPLPEIETIACKPKEVNPLTACNESLLLMGKVWGITAATVDNLQTLGNIINRSIKCN